MICRKSTLLFTRNRRLTSSFIYILHFVKLFYINITCIICLLICYIPNISLSIQPITFFPKTLLPKLSFMTFVVDLIFMKRSFLWSRKQLSFRDLHVLRSVDFCISSCCMRPSRAVFVVKSSSTGELDFSLLIFLFTFDLVD